MSSKEVKIYEFDKLLKMVDTNTSETMTIEELKKYWNLWNDLDICMDGFDTFEDWLEESVKNGYYTEY